jgi:gliding motility-associated-like protein
MISYTSSGRRHLFIKAIFVCLMLVSFSFSGNAQILVSTDKTAAILAGELLGSGVTIMSPRLTCAGNANGTFTTTVVSPIGIGRGIILTSGSAKDTLGGIGVNDPSTSFANTINHMPGDPQLNTLAGHTTWDACVLEFDFKASGDTIRFNYVFGSEEYPGYTCSPYNDVFGFFISGGAYTVPTNIALVPGTTIPVCINSVNIGTPSTGYLIDSCNILGPGSPFSLYYVNNTIGPASPYVTYDGLTTRLTAIARVNPCDTYHLKLGVADAVDSILDSGVFIEGGSLSSTPPAVLTAVGTGALMYAGMPCCIRGCAPGRFNFSIPDPRDTNYIVRYLITGSAANGYDYGTIADSVTILATTTSSTVAINPLLVTPAGPKIVKITIQVPDPCHPGVYTNGDTALIVILDSFSFHIITPDTLICQGQHVDINAVGDTSFPGILFYRWTPGATITPTDTILRPTATPFVTTTYTLRDSTAPALGCPVKSHAITITVYNRPALTVDSPLVKTCVGVPVDLHVYGAAGTLYNYLWTPPTDLSNTTIFNPVVNPTTPGDVIYTVTVGPSILPGCSSTATIHVHTLPNDFLLLNPDTAICIGQSVQVRLIGSVEFNWLWTPPSGVSVTTIRQPIITPTVTTTYTVTASYAHCPDMAHSFRIEVDVPAPTRVFTDTICLGMSDSVDFTSTDPGYYHYQWTPATYLNNDTIPNPVFTPTASGAFTWSLVIQPHAAGCASLGQVNLLVAPNSISIKPNDTAICAGDPVQVRGVPYPLFAYRWLPTAGISMPNIINPLIIPDTSDTYVVTATFNKCPDMHDTLRIDVQPKPVVYAGGNRFVCMFDTLHIHATVNPAWYGHYSYLWSPPAGLDYTTTSSIIYTATGILPTTLTLTVTTPAGCKTEDSVYITIYPGDFASLQPATMSFCPHDTAILLPVGGYSYHWYPSLYLSDSLSSQPIIRPITSQNYTIIATSGYGCKDTLHFSATVHPAAVFYMIDSITLHPGEFYQIDPQTNCSYFTWFPAAGLDYWKISNPLATPQISTRYFVHAQTEYGCKIVDSIDIFVDPETILVLPNAFSPGSSPNSEFKIIKRGIATLNYFRIFNRWGNLVFETSDIDKGWNGEYKGVPQPYGVFVYEVEAMTSSGKLFRKHGNVTLIR